MGFTDDAVCQRLVYDVIWRLLLSSPVATFMFCTCGGAICLASVLKGPNPSCEALTIVEILVRSLYEGHHASRLSNSELQDNFASRTHACAGDHVEGLYSNGKDWYPGRILAVNADGTYSVLYDDGEFEPKVTHVRKCVESSFALESAREKISSALL